MASLCLRVVILSAAKALSFFLCVLCPSSVSSVLMFSLFSARRRFFFPSRVQREMQNRQRRQNRRLRP